MRRLKEVLEREEEDAVRRRGERFGKLEEPRRPRPLHVGKTGRRIERKTRLAHLHCERCGERERRQQEQREDADYLRPLRAAMRRRSALRRMKPAASAWL